MVSHCDASRETSAAPMTMISMTKAAHAMTRDAVALSRMPMIFNAAKMPTPVHERSTTWLSRKGKTLPTY